MDVKIGERKKVCITVYLEKQLSEQINAFKGKITKNYLEEK